MEQFDQVIIIAEAGVNHNGSIEMAKQLIEQAAEAGADYVKFQTFIAEEGISKNAEKASYQKVDKDEESQLEMVKKLELTPQMHEELIEHCHKLKIKFLSTAFDLYSVDLLTNYQLEVFKIPSGEITNLVYLEYIAKANFPKYYLSTGMSNLSDIENALSILINNGVKRENITVLHCNTEYPTPMSDVNLRAMQTIKEAFKVEIGYSDHTLGIEVPIAAVAMGAKVIEKHFTLDKTLDGPDHQASLEPKELKQMVTSIRNIECALGSGIKKPSTSENKNISIVRKSIIAKKEIKKGELFTEENLTVKRPGTGLSPMSWYEVIGTKSLKDYDPDDVI